MSEARKRALEAKLSVKQREAAMLCVERELSDVDERKTYEEIADEVGYSRMELYRLRTRNKAFIEYVNIFADDYLDSKRAHVYRQLLKLIEGPQPSVKGIDLYLRRHGLLTERSVVETKEAGGARDNEDIAKELAELDEILSEE